MSAAMLLNELNGQNNVDEEKNTSALQDPSIKELNQLINIIDPPKDLAISTSDGNRLTESTHGRAIKTMIEELFANGEPLPAGFVGVGDKKSVIIDSVERRLGLQSKLDIVREKHSSGHDPRPEGLYLAQDAGPMDVVSNPKIIVTPGSILDPAGKTKEGIINLVTEGIYNTLPKEYLNKLSMSIITGDIKVESDTDTYKVNIPTQLGDINGVFNKRTFSPETDYFKGNDTKNEYIFANYLTNKNECEKYILAKELGDTLQVIWLDYIFDTNEEITRERTVIVTVDTVVCYRAIVNRVGSILTHMGRTTYFLPRTVDAAQLAAINKSFVLTVANEVLTHNESVITVIKKVISSSVGLEDNKDIWVNGQTWYPAAVVNAKKYLENIIVPKLESIKRDLAVRFNALTDLEAAKALASQPTAHFKNPFILTKSGYYKTINSVILLTEGVPFIAKLFQPTKFSAGNPMRGFFVGGAKIQSGGMYDSEIYTLNKDKPFFLYCYIRDFHPEIFKYAYMMAPRLIPFYLEKEYDIGYYYDGANFIVERPLLDKEEEIKSITGRSIELAKTFTSTFPQLLTPGLGGFLELFPALIDSMTSESYAAIDLYEVYYSLRISRSYSGGEVTEDEVRDEVDRISSVIYDIEQYIPGNNITAIQTNTEEPQRNIILRKKTINDTRKIRLAPYSTYKYLPRFSYRRPEKKRMSTLKTLGRLTKGSHHSTNIMREVNPIQYRKTRKHRK